MQFEHKSWMGTDTQVCLGVSSGREAAGQRNLQGRPPVGWPFGSCRKETERQEHVWSLG